MESQKYHSVVQQFLGDFVEAGYDYLLTREEEVRLGRRYRSGRYEVLPRNRRCPECREAVRTHKAWKAHKHYSPVWGGRKSSRDAYWELVACNVRWVASIAKKMMVPGMKLEDLLQIGMQGLIHGITKWDPERGIRLSTYVTWWIRQAIQKERDTAYIVRIPQYVRELVWHLPRATARLKSKGMPVNNETLCAEMNCTPGQLEATYIGCKVHRHFTSLERHPGGDEDSVFPIEFKANDSIEAAPPDQLVEEAERRELVARALLVVEEKFGKRAVDIIILRFGLGDHEEMTLEALGEKMNLSRERIRQIEVKAIKYLAKLCKANPKRASISTGKVPQLQV